MGYYDEEDSEKDEDIKLGFIVCGIMLMIISALLLVFIPIGLKEAFGLGIIMLIGLGLTVAGSPDPRKK